MFENFMNKTKKEKIETVKKAGGITLKLAGVGALSYIIGRSLGFRDGIDWFWEKGREWNNQVEESEQIEVEEEEEAQAQASSFLLLVKEDIMAGFPTEFTEQELNDWLNTLDVHYSLAILEKLYKDFRDYSLTLHDQAVRNSH